MKRSIFVALGLAAASAAGCATSEEPTEAESESAVETSTTATTAGTDRVIEAACDYVSDRLGGSPPIELLSEVAKEYGKWCASELQSGKSLAECAPTACNLGEWAPGVAGAIVGSTGGNTNAVGTIAKVAEKVGKTFNATSGQCGAGLFCAEYDDGSCATDGGGGDGASACHVYDTDPEKPGQSCHLLGHSLVTSSGPDGNGGVFAQQTCNIYPTCNRPTSPWHPPVGSAIPGGAPASPLPAPAACGPIAAFVLPDTRIDSYPFADTSEADRDVWDAGLEIRESRLVAELLAGVQSYRLGTLPASSTTAPAPAPSISDADLQAFFDFARFDDCGERTELLSNLPWFAGMMSFGRVAADDQARFSEAARMLARSDFLALTRILASIPNVTQRLAYLASRSWGQLDGDAHLARVQDPDGILLRALGPVGFKILRGSFTNYRFFAVPVPGETPPASTCDAIAACTPPTKPVFGLAVGAQSTDSSVTLSVSPSSTVGLEGGRATMRINWGDGSLQTFPANTTTRTLAHGYASKGIYEVEVTLRNEGGATTTQRVSVAANASSAAAKTIRSIRTIQLTTSVVLQPTLKVPTPSDDFVVEVHEVLADGQSSFLGITHMAAPASAPRTAHSYGQRIALAPVTVAVTRDHAPHALRFRIRAADHPEWAFNFSAHFAIESINLQMVGAGSEADEWASFRPTSTNTLLRPSGATPVSAKQDIDGNFVMLPFDGTIVDVELPTTCQAINATPVGCRPTRDATGRIVDDPRFVSAGGGCYDRDTRMTWSTADKTRLSWHEVMWDVEAGGSAPEPSDGISTNDYDNRDTVSSAKDKLETSYCHDLVEGGQTDWRVPRLDELENVMYRDVAGKNFRQLSPTPLLSSSSFHEPGANSEAADYFRAQAISYHPSILYPYMAAGNDEIYRDQVLKTAKTNFAMCARPLPTTRHYCRGSITGSGLFVTAGGGCADTQSKRVWSLPSPRNVTSATAAQYCDNLVEGGKSDWRLPTRDELTTSITAAAMPYLDASDVYAGDYSKDRFWAGPVGALSTWPSNDRVARRALCVRDEAQALVIEPQPPAPAPNTLVDIGTCGGKMLTRRPNPSLASSFFSDANGWAAASYTGTVRAADVNGDGRADLIGRGPSGVVVQLSNGESFGPAVVKSGFFSDANGFNPAQYSTTVQSADVDGDGKADLLGRGVGGIWVQLATGSGGDFGAAVLRSSFFSDANGFAAVAYYPSIQAADVDGDGKSDLIGRGRDGIYVQLATGGAFAPAKLVSGFFSDANGFNLPQYAQTIRVADVNGDGKADLIGRGRAGIYVQLATGTIGNAQFAVAGSVPASTWFSDALGWNQSPYYTSIGAADLDGDNKADLYGRAGSGIWVQYSLGNATFGAAMQIGSVFSDANGFAAPAYSVTIRAADVDGDGKADLLGRRASGEWLQLMR